MRSWINPLQIRPDSVSNGTPTRRGHTAVSLEEFHEKPRTGHGTPIQFKVPCRIRQQFPLRGSFVLDGNVRHELRRRGGTPMRGGGREIETRGTLSPVVLSLSYPDNWQQTHLAVIRRERGEGDAGRDGSGRCQLGHSERRSCVTATDLTGNSILFNVKAYFLRLRA